MGYIVLVRSSSVCIETTATSIHSREDNIRFQSYHMHVYSNMYRNDIAVVSMRTVQLRIYNTLIRSPPKKVSKSNQNIAFFITHHLMD